MSNPIPRRRAQDRAAEAPEATPAPTPSAASPLAAFLDDAEAALSELREFEAERRANGESR